ncbi:hypothetical protein F5884DRAFT_769463 [Xylogone sp. PMI_703]|nr:hypothetical protein F5884DRAFT_769463 [Xylogone sp. PMI_703]
MYFPTMETAGNPQQQVSFFHQLPHYHHGIRRRCIPWESVHVIYHVSPPLFHYRRISSSNGYIPVKLDIRDLHDDHGRRSQQNGNEKIASSHVHARRRAQNRASQRAFRDRKEKRLRELESRLKDLEARHSELTASYDSLQVEYANVKEELERIRRESENLTGLTFARNDYQVEGVDPLLFNNSTFYYEEEKGI